jgi:transposase
VPRDLDVHLAMDNYATHKTPLIRKWLAKRPRWHVHLTPTSSSWLNQVERFFALLTDKKIQTRHLRKRCRPHGRHRFLYRMPQRRSQTVPMDQVGRRYPRVRRTLLRASDASRPLSRL